jgi:hypothetical protein
MSRSLLLLASLVALLCSSLLVSAHFDVHPLSKIHLHNIQTKLDGGVSTANTRYELPGPRQQPAVPAAQHFPHMC